MKSYLAAFFILLALGMAPSRLACAEPQSWVVGSLAADNLGDIGRVKVIKHQNADSPEECRAFKLTEAQVVYFLEHAKVISDYQKRVEYPYYPCYAEGKVETKSGTYSWEISAGGSGGVWKKLSSIAYLACGVECKDIFIEVGPDGVMTGGG